MNDFTGSGNPGTNHADHVIGNLDRNRVSIVVGGGGVVVVRFVKLLVSDRLLLKECINFIQTLQKSQASLNTGQVEVNRKILTK